uniref:DUF3730 domain-containing protein n=1 Tax=Photinus pyralis TaxID=7054 RepID=A0A1Y1MEH0_PHOPY
MEYYKEKQYNAIFVTQSFSKVLETIKNNKENSEELRQLINKSLHSDNGVLSLTACSSLLMLVEDKSVQISTILSQLLSSLSFTKTHGGVVSLVCDLLKIDMKEKIKVDKRYKNDYNLKVPQHPFISILNQHPKAWTSILNKISLFYECSEIKFYANEQLYPLFMYTICNPSADVNDTFQYKLWNFVINVSEPQSLDVVVHVILWLPISARHSLAASSFFIELTKTQRFNSDRDFREVIILWLTSLIYELLKFEEDPLPLILCLLKLMQNDQEIVRNSGSSVLVMLTNSLLLCSTVFLPDILRLCRLVIQTSTCNELSLKLLKISILHWTAFKNVLTNKSLEVANEIILYIESNKSYVNNTQMLYSNRLFKILSTSNEYLHFTVQVNILAERLTQAEILSWLERISTMPEYIASDMINFLISLLIFDNIHSDIIVKTIEILVRICKVYQGLSTQTLIVLLYILSHSRDPRVNVAVLKAIPKMAVLDENLPLVLNILDLTRKGIEGMKSFYLRLYLDLWETKNKCYSHLQSLLADSGFTEKSENAKIEFYTMKAYVGKQLCLKSPERYGSELVSHLSDILNKCKGEAGTVATSLVLEGIVLLCKSGIISISSTWDALQPLFQKEARAHVIQRYCEFMAEVSYFDASECSDVVITSIIQKLFSYAINSENGDVVCAAYKALSCFPVDEVLVELCNCLDTSLPVHSKTGNPWISLLLNSKESDIDAVGNMLSKFISLEIRNFRKGVYLVPEGRKEPHNYNYLPERSILRAIGNYIKAELENWQLSNTSIYLQCLRVLSQEYSKALPPFDWCFLQEIIHIPEARISCIIIASHQVQLSGTARRLVENYLEAVIEFDGKDEEIITVYSQLSFLCNSIQPVTLRPFIEKSLHFALQRPPTLHTLLHRLQDILANDTIQETNKATIAQILVNITWALSLDDQCFTPILNCIIRLPKRFIDELSSPKLWKTASPDLLRLSVKIRCATALHTNSLTWINEFIEEACFSPFEQYFVLIHIGRLMENFRNSDLSSTWILEYIGYVQTSIANESSSNYNLQFLCNVLIIIVIILSGHNVFTTLEELIKSQETYLNLFPQSLAKLIKLPYWKDSVGQVAEWIFHMSNCPETPKPYKLMFYQTLTALRHDSTVQSSRWMKYISQQLPSD